eukprot:465170-Ditylum_brightwellii.AAC.1
MMDRFYSNIDSRMLHLLRVNRTVPLYSGKDQQGKRMANWSLDGIIEMIQKYYHSMNFDNSKEGWMRHSENVTL